MIGNFPWLLLFSSALLAQTAPHYFYALNENSGRISGFEIASNGALVPAPGSPFASGAASQSIAADPTGRFLYTANYGASISAFRIDPHTGALAALAGSPFLIQTNSLNGLTIDPTGRFLYAVCECGYAIPFTIDANLGALTPAGPAVVGGGMSNAVVHPSGKYLYMPALNVWSYTINTSTGAIAQFNETEGRSAWVTIDPAGRYLYGDSTGIGEMDVFAINPATGLLTAIPGSPFPAPPAVYSAAQVSPGGKFLYVVGAGTEAFQNNVTGYRIDAATGAPFGSTPGSPVITPSTPDTITFDPSGRFVYVGSRDTNTVSGFGFDASTGALAELSGSPFATEAGIISATAAPSFEPFTKKLESLAVSPAVVSVPATAIGTSGQLTASGVFSDQLTYTVTASASWTSSNTAVAVVANYPEHAGSVTIQGVGIAIISGAYAGKSASATITVQ